MDPMQTLLGQRILDVGVGHPIETIHRAMNDAFATSVGGVCHLSGLSLMDALLEMDRFHIAARQHRRDNWGRIARGDH